MFTYYHKILSLFFLFVLSFHWETGATLPSSQHDEHDFEVPQTGATENAFLEKMRKKLQKNSQLEKLINKEMKLLITMNKMDKYSSPDLLYRLLELYGEKMRLVRMKENDLFLKESLKNPKVKKASYFKKSTFFYKRARKLGSSIINRFPKFEKISSVFYAMALNSRDFSNGRKSTKYFLYAIANAPKNSEIAYNSKAGLADHYYNLKRYNLAIPLYQEVVKNNQDQWQTKYLLNLSWCYLKKKYYNKAISHLKKAYLKSKKGGEVYIDVSDQVLDNIGLFFAISNQVIAGIDFYKKHVEKPVPYLIKMADMLIKRGLFDFSDKVLNETLRLTKLPAERVSAYLLKLELYKQFAQNRKFYQTVKDLYQLHQNAPLEERSLAEFLERTAEFIAFLQAKTAEQLSSGPLKTKMRVALLIGTLKIMAKLDPENRDQYAFREGETYYSQKNYLKAVKRYIAALKYTLPSWRKYQKMAKTNQSDGEHPKKASKQTEGPEEQDSAQKTGRYPKEKLQKDIFTSLLASLSIGRFTKNQKDSYLIFSYSHYIKIFPKGDKAISIFERLYQLYQKRKLIAKMDALVLQYASVHPSRVASQRQMATQLLDNYILYKKAPQLAKWVKKLDEGFLGFQKPFIRKAELILGNILFENNHQLANKNKTTEAIDGYLDLYQNDIYSRNIRGKSAINAADLYLKLVKTEKAYDLLKEGIGLIDDVELLKQNSLIAGFTFGLFYHQNPDLAGSLGRKMLNHYCPKKEGKKLTKFRKLKAAEKKDLIESLSIYYKNAVLMNFVAENFRESIDSYQNFSHCPIPKKIRSVVSEQLAHFISSIDYQSIYPDFMPLLIKDPKLSQIIVFNLFEQFRLAQEKYLVFSQNHGIAEKNWAKKPLFSLMKNYPHVFDKKLKKIITFYEKTDMALKNRIKKSLMAPIALKSQTFNEQEFAQALTARINLIQKIKTKLEGLLNINYRPINIKLYYYLQESFASLGTVLSNFRPKGVSKEYKKAFDQQIHSVSKKFKDQALHYKKLALSLIESENVMSYSNFLIQDFRQFPITPMYSYIYQAIPIDGSIGGGGRKK